ncbi:MAG TPA: TraR/DksA C4-type zinc finger protein [Chloroflexota bacterium]|nr:TraR/DksA C4-type zinc finger protein [Chloroflexota bacterium]HEX2987397.1 TraR/DksA C4-type zinc finger protein [Chloroflexota bacterium]
MEGQENRGLSAVKAALQAELDGLNQHLREMADTAQRERRAEGNRPGFGKRVGDYTAEVQEATNNRAVVQNMGRAMDELRRALEKVDEGSYGLCDGCGRPIAPERLEVMPSAVLCIECKRKREQRRR